MTTAQQFERRRWIALALLAMAQFVVVLDASIVNVALPTIGESLTFSQDDLSWVVNAYVLTFGGFLLLGGRLADLLGRRRVFMAGLVLFALASLVGGFAESETALIAARAVQGLGAAILSPAALSIVTTTFRDGSERNKALGVWGAVAGAGGAAGVLLGGVLTEYLGWEWVLWVNVPIGIGAAALAPSLIAESRSESESRAFDFAGAVSVTTGLALLVYALVEAPDAGWGSTQTIGLLGGAVGLLAALRRHRAPLGLAAGAVLDLPHANADRGERGRAAHRRLPVLDVLLHLALHAERARLQRDQGGALVFAARGHDHPRRRRRVTAGDQDRLQAGARRRHGADRRSGCCGSARSRPAAASPPTCSVPRCSRRSGSGSRSCRRRSPPSPGVAEREAGLASGLINTSQQIGGALGLAVLSTVAFPQINDAAAAAGGAPSPAALTDGYADAFMVGAGIAFLGLIATVLMIRGSDSRAHVDAGRGRRGGRRAPESSTLPAR